MLNWKLIIIHKMLKKRENAAKMKYNLINNNLNFNFIYFLKHIYLNNWD